MTFFTTLQGVSRIRRKVNELASCQDQRSREYLGVNSAIMVLTSRAVQFSDVQIRLYAMILGDNPATRRGLPVTIEWNHFDSSVQSIDDAENLRYSSPRNHKPPRLKTDDRREYLISLGVYSAADLVSVLVEMQQIRLSRRENAGQQNMDKLGDLLDASAGFFLRGKSVVITASIGAVSAVLKSSKEIGDSSATFIRDTATGIKRGSMVAVDGAISVGMATGDVVGKLGRQGSQLAANSITAANTVARLGSVVAVNTAVNAGKVTSNATLHAGKAATKAALSAGRATTQVAKATAADVARTTVNAVNVVVRAPLDLTKNAMTGVRGTQPEESGKRGPSPKPTDRVAQALSLNHL